MLHFTLRLNPSESVKGNDRWKVLSKPVAQTMTSYSLSSSVRIFMPEEKWGSYIVAAPALFSR